jgi:hypothetical protein
MLFRPWNMFCVFTLALIIIIAAHVVDCVRQYCRFACPGACRMLYTASATRYSTEPKSIVHTFTRIECYKSTRRFHQIFICSLFNNVLKNSYNIITWNS